MNDEFIVVYQFLPNKTKSNQAFATIKKKIPESKIENLGDCWAIVLGHFDTKKEAEKMIHKAVELGYWGGIWLP